MNKLLLLGIAATLGAAKLALLPANPPVDLQPTSPGTAQTGHLNISGTATVGLLKSQGTVFGASTAPTGFAYGGFFTAASNQGRGFYGFASSPTGLTHGGFFQNASNQGRAVYGLNTATSGTTFGGYFQSASTTGRGLFGVAIASSGTNYGVYGRSFSPAGYGVYSEGNMGASGVISGNGSGLTNLNAANLTGTIYLTGSTIGAPINALNNNPSGRGFEGIADNVSGSGHGVVGLTNGSGAGVWGDSGNTTSPGMGVQGTSAGNTGSGVYGYSSHGSGLNYGVRGKTNSPNGFGVYSDGNMHATGVISGNGSGLTNLNATNLATGTVHNARLPVPMILSGDILGGSILSVTNTSPSASYAVEVTGGVTAGVRANGGAVGVSGSGSQKGGDFAASGTDGYGVIGFANATSGATCGVLGDVASTSGTAIWARNFATSGTNYALRARNESIGGTAGHFTSPGPDAVVIENFGPGRGLRVNSTMDTAIWGVTTSGLGGVDGRAANSASVGVFGFNSTVGIGVLGQSTGGFGLYAAGNTGATGTKSFRIDHPFDPLNKYLLHYSTESPTPQNFYSGNAKTDSQGKAWVVLPAYFAEINANFKYQLTVLDDSESQQFVQVKVGRKIQGNRFLIMSSAPNVEVSWRVEADRIDAFVKHYGAPTEVDKESGERGTYQHPELYGAGPEMATNYARLNVGQKGTPKRPADPARK